MATIFKVISASNDISIQDEIMGCQDNRYLTLTETGEGSDNRYYVSLTGKAANVDWQEGDRIMVELNFIAYKNRGQWHSSHHSYAINLIEIENSHQKNELYDDWTAHLV